MPDLTETTYRLNVADWEPMQKTFTPLKGTISKSRFAVWWRSNSEYRRKLSEALRNWEMAVRFADEHEAAMTAVEDEPWVHPG